MGRLKDAFDEHVAAVADARAEAEDEGFWAGVARSLDELVTVRRIDESEGDSRDARLVRIEAALQADNLALALDEVAGLDADARRALAGWEERAQARLNVLGAQSVLMRFAGIDAPAPMN